jgi:ABC-2 type transport system permease protein
MDRFVAFLIRVSSFLRKEAADVLRQPRFIFTLVLGPFLILLLFGIGFRNQAEPLQALFVVPEGNPMADYVGEYAEALSPAIEFVGITSSEGVAMSRLRDGTVDLVVVAPEDAYEMIQRNEQAVFTLYHNEIDPLEVDYVNAVGQIYVHEVNRRVLRSIAQEEQTEAAELQAELSAARASASSLREALAEGDLLQAGRSLSELDRRLEGVQASMGSDARLLGGVGAIAGGAAVADSPDDPAVMLDEVQRDREALGAVDEDEDDMIERVARLEQNLARMEANVDEFRRIDPFVAVSPFRSEVETVAEMELDFTDFYAPAVIVLLLQHLCITFGGLSIVRERGTGTMELFQVSPLSAGEVLLGKYLSYTILTGLLALVLSLLTVYILRVPMLGNWGSFTLALGVLVLASLGIGFTISLLAQTTGQVVQYAMILLLASVFFSGFFQSLDMLRPGVRVISWLLPATYGIQLLQAIMLRAEEPRYWLLLVLGLMAVVLVGVSWRLLHQAMSAE